MTDKRVRVFATADIGSAALDLLRGRGYDVEVYAEVDAPPKSLIVEKVKSGVDALITTLRDPIDEEVFSAGAAMLRVVAQIAVGVDNIDRAAANRHRVPFTNTPDVLTEATAEFALFILGAVSRKLYQSEKLVEDNLWGSWHPYHPFLGDEVTGKTVAVVGVGRIGQAFAKKCVGLDVDLLLHGGASRDAAFVERLDREMQHRYESEFSPARHTVAYVSFEEALARADYVSLHVPLVTAGQSDRPTYHLMNRSAFELMKPTAYLINTSRGLVVDERALYEALIESRIAGAALDVFEREPLAADSPLRSPALRDRLRLFHHFASGTRETRLSADPDKGMAGRTVQALIDVIENNYGGDPSRMPYVVNKEAFSKC
ncbi:MAG TPA: NAD(P)-dependent oxidoreductase [Blastocatellia bacterium]|nr:NAD(P)-dependent oxidoreductase [Blastocatellia bacterium]